MIDGMGMAMFAMKWNGLMRVLTHETIHGCDLAIGVEFRVDCYRSPSISPDLIVRLKV